MSKQHRLLEIFNSIDFTEEKVSVPRWEIMDPAQVNQVLKSCEVKSAGHVFGDGVGGAHINIPMVHRLLNDELNNIQGATALSQRAVIQQDMNRYEEF